jgi:hypothetical protein
MKKRRWSEKMIFGLGASVIQNIAHYGAGDSTAERNTEKVKSGLERCREKSHINGSISYFSKVDVF